MTATWTRPLAAALLLLATTACPTAPDAPVLERLVVEPEDLELAAGRSAWFEAYGVYSDDSREDMTDQVGWLTGDPDRAEVDAGFVTTHAAGSTSVTATFELLAASALLTIGPAEVDALVPHPLSLELAVGEEASLSVTALLTDGNALAVDAEVAWSSSDGSVVQVADGVATGVAAGEAEIVVEHGAVQATIPVEVADLGLVAIDIVPANPLIPLGAELALQALGRLVDGSTQDVTATALWSSSDPSHVLFEDDAPGVAQAVGEGGAIVEASVGGTVGDTVATVIDAEVVALVLDPDSLELPLGASMQVTAFGSLSDGGEIDLTAAAVWSSDDPLVASARNDLGHRGLVVTAGEGETTIRAVWGDLEAIGPIVVGPAELLELDVTPADPSVPFGLSQAFAATGTWSDGAILDHTADALWSADPAGLVSWAGEPGVAQPLGVGATLVTASFGGLDASTDLVITAPELATIAVTPPGPEAAVGELIQFEATATLTDGSNTDVTTTVFWGSSAPGFATVNNLSGSEGQAEAVAPGLATILATSGPVSGAAVMTVVPAEPATLDVEPDPAGLVVGATASLTATATLTDGSDQDVTGTVLWSSSSPAVATTSNDVGLEGTVTGVGVGIATVTATLGDLQASVTVTVSGAR